MELRAFHNDGAVKEKYLTRVRHHQKMDHLVRGEGWNGKRGCAVGCTLETYNHSLYPVELGIPEWLARVEDTLFEGVTEEKSRTWPEKFLDAIHIGSDLEKAKVPFLVVVLEHTLVSMDKAQYDKKKWPAVTKVIEGSKAAVRQMIEAQKSGDRKLIEAADSAYSAADSAYSAADSAYSAADSAYSAADSARSAAYSAADSARSAAYSAAYSAYSAYSAADSARSAYSAADSARSAARSAAYDYFADELLKILESIQ